MPGQWQPRSNKPQSNPQELWAKDRTMASMNAAQVAVQLVSLEEQTGKLEASPTDRFLELYEVLYDQHMQRGGDIGAAVNNVTRAFPGSEVQQAPAAGPTSYTEGPGGVTIGFGKHQGLTIAQVYATDPTYIRNYLAEKAREPELLNAARAFVAQVDAA